MSQATKALNNEQRTRLENIARDEFRFKESELVKAKQSVLNKWKETELAKINKDPLLKKYIAAGKERDKIVEVLSNKGYCVSNFNGNQDAKIIFSNSGDYRYDPATGKNVQQSKHVKFEEMTEAAAVSRDVFTRAMNKVLAVIWSMEQSFTECLKLIETEVKKIK